MGSKVLVGAVVGAVVVWGGAFALVQRRIGAIALDAPQSRADGLAVLADPESFEQPRVPDSVQRDGLNEQPQADPEPSYDPEETGPPLPLDADRIAALIRDLRDDDVRGNARSALFVLEWGGDEVLEPLEQALRSNDWQQRQLAGYVLARRANAAATPALADVLIEALDGGPLPCGPLHDPNHPGTAIVTTSAHVHECALERLRTDAALFALAESRIALRLNSDAPYARVEAAYLLAVRRSELARRRVLSTLIGALEDNDIAGDARLGLRGLVRLGASSAEALECAWPGRDAQQRALIGHLLSKFSPQHAGAHALTARQLSRLGFPVGDPLRISEYPLEP